MLTFRTNSTTYSLAPVAVALWHVSQVAAALDRHQRALATPSIARIQVAVCERFKLKPIYMHSQRRHRDICRPRQIAMYLCRELTPRSLPQIGRAFGGRDHTTVLHACRQVETLRAADPDIDAAVRDLTEQLSSPREGVAQAQGA